MRKLILFLTLLPFLTVKVFAQNEVTVYFTPTSILKGEMEVDLELGLPQYPNSKFLLATKLRGGQLNNGERYTINNSTFREGDIGDDIFKVGIDLQHRLFIRDQELFRNSVYLAYNLNYGFSEISYDIIPISSGVGISTDKEIYSHRINSLGISTVIGKRFNNRKYLVLDLFTGVRLNKSFVKVNAPVTLRNYNEGYLSPAYTGIAPILGFRIGLLLQKFTEE